MKSAEHVKAWQMRIDLDGAWPPVWRRILVPGGINLLELHEIIQDAFGWEDYHLHQYIIRGVEYGDPENDEYGDWDIHDETVISLSELDLAPGESFSYTYDFGDNWTHTLRVERILTVEGRKRLPRCLGGERACPPEDVGGIGGYAEFLDALADPGHPEHDRFQEWIGGSFDPERFDPKNANRRLADRAAAKRAPVWARIPERYRDAPLSEPSDWRPADRQKHADTARNLPLRRDVLALLVYLRDHKVTGASSSGNLPLKTVTEVAAAFVDPPPVGIRLGNTVYPARSEEEVWPVYFVHILANGADLVAGGPGRRWRLTKRGERYFDAPADLQVRTLLIAWWHQVNWTVATRYNIFDEVFSSRFPRSAQKLFKQLEVGQSVEYEPFVDRLIREIGLRWEAEAEESERMREYIGSSLERMLIEPLEALGILSGQRSRDEEAPFRRERLRAFSLTAFGRMLFETLRYW